MHPIFQRKRLSSYTPRGDTIRLNEPRTAYVRRSSDSNEQSKSIPITLWHIPNWQIVTRCSIGTSSRHRLMHSTELCGLHRWPWKRMTILQRPTPLLDL